jgi:ParB family chromosome partitioning protein
MSTTHIQLSKLHVSTANARKTFSKAGIEEMQASIIAHGLMQNLVVTEGDKGKYYVVAGGRRLAALNALQKTGKLPKVHEVPCRIVTEEEAAELSLAENTVREAMHPVDEFQAFARLIDEGATAEQVAARFGKTEKQVLQRMKLARVAPVILKAYRAEEISLEVVMAFTITDDQKRQAKVFKELQGWMRDNPREIRARLTDKMVRKDDCIARFVGISRYEKAGGTLRTDLFGDEVFLENPELLQALAKEKLTAAIEALQAEGWSWIETEDTSLAYRCEHLEPAPESAPTALIKERDKLKKKIAEFEEKYQAASDEDEEEELLDARNKAEGELEVVDDKLEAYKTYTPEQKSISGCCVSIDHGGKLDITKGLVRPEDRRKSSQPEDEPQDEESEAEDKPKMPESLKRDLEGYRQQIAQAEIASHPAIAFDLMAFTIAFKSLSDSTLHSGAAINFSQQYPTPTVRQDKTKASDTLAKLRAGLSVAWLSEETESAQFAAFRELSREDKDRILAYCTAMTLQPQLHNPGAFEDALALTGASVAEYWRPTATNYLSRIKRQQLIEIGRAIRICGDQWVERNKNAKKSVLVAELDSSFAVSHNPDTLDAIKNWLPEGMAFTTAEKQPSKAKKKAA